MRAPQSAEVGQKILDWIDDMEGRILRGDMMIGILTVDEVAKMPAALRRAPECGQKGAWLKLAHWHENPPIRPVDYEAADRALVAAVQHEVPGAVLALGRLRWFRRRDQASAEEKQQVLELLRARAETDDQGEALHLLGLMTCGGFGTAADPTAAFGLQKRSAERGNADAHFELYVHLSTGLGVEVDDEAALVHNQEAAELGHARAAYNMGAFNATGKLVAKDMAEAARWYQEACDAGNGKACATLAALYATGDGVAKDLDRARGLFDVAEEMGFDPSAIQAAIGWSGDED